MDENKLTLKMQKDCIGIECNPGVAHRFYSRPDRFVELLSLLPIIILLLYFLFSIDLVYTGIVARLEERKSNCLLK